MIDKNSKNQIISIIIPTFNEQANIKKLLDQLLALDFFYELEIIFVDDNSRDGTANIIRQYSKNDRRIRLINRIGRSGLSSAIKEGCLCASGDFLSVIDADGQHEPYSIIKALKTIENKKVDMIIGSRFIKGAIIQGLTKNRQNGSSLANKLAGISLFGAYDHLTDFMSGFMLFKRNSCIKFIEKIDLNGFKFLYELLALSKGQLKVLEIPLTFKEREYGISKLDLPVVWDFLISLVHNFCRRLLPRRAISFALVGSIGVFVQLFSIYILIWLTNINFEKVLPIGVIIAASSNFIINNILTFRANKLSGRSFYLGLMKFLLVSSLPIIANIGVTTLFYNQLSTNSLVSQFAGILVVFIWNYAASSKVVWNN